MRSPDRAAKAKIISFADTADGPLVDHATSQRYGDVTFIAGVFKANPGAYLGTTQLVISLNSGAPVPMVWFEQSKRHECMIAPGTLSITPPRRPFLTEWGRATPEMNIMAIGGNLVRRILRSAGMNPQSTFPAVFGIRDGIVRQLMEACQNEKAAASTAGQRFVEGIAIALVTHIYRKYADQRGNSRVRGGLTARHEHHIRSYIERNLHRGLCTNELAEHIGLSPHYFTEAFKRTIGVTPYQYILRRRVEHAGEMLLHTDLSIAEIAIAVGFSNQGQLTTNFQNILGNTPARFRREYS